MKLTKKNFEEYPMIELKCMSIDWLNEDIERAEAEACINSKRKYHRYDLYDILRELDTILSDETCITYEERMLIHYLIQSQYNREKFNIRK